MRVETSTKLDVNVSGANVAVWIEMLPLLAVSALAVLLLPAPLPLMTPVTYMLMMAVEAG